MRNDEHRNWVQASATVLAKGATNGIVRVRFPQGLRHSRMFCCHHAGGLCPGAAKEANCNGKYSRR
jgi:hypothetical protein